MVILVIIIGLGLSENNAVNSKLSIRFIYQCTKAATTTKHSDESLRSSQVVAAVSVYRRGIVYAFTQQTETGYAARTVGLSLCGASVDERLREAFTDREM